MREHRRRGCPALVVFDPDATKRVVGARFQIVPGGYHQVGGLHCEWPLPWRGRHAGRPEVLCKGREGDRRICAQSLDEIPVQFEACGVASSNKDIAGVVGALSHVNVGGRVRVLAGDVEVGATLGDLLRWMAKSRAVDVGARPLHFIFADLLLHVLAQGILMRFGGARLRALEHLHSLPARHRLEADGGLPEAAHRILPVEGARGERLEGGLHEGAREEDEVVAQSGARTTHHLGLAFRIEDARVLADVMVLVIAQEEEGDGEHHKAQAQHAQ
mmetsp:Transcript_8537/g.18210  ORF Transcript_8537/g.18210 Transcript_8537/m.18210 type:complete len:273 (+) Transcript_8537:659-1477(+)